MTIFLCGFMGCGKSTIGAKLSKLLGVPFTDMDTYIEEQAGRTIPEIFEQDGENYTGNSSYSLEADLADGQSMRNAIYMALDVIRQRAEYDELTANPLPFIERDDKEGRPRREFMDFKTTKYSENLIEKNTKNTD